jgi:TIR domain
MSSLADFYSSDLVGFFSYLRLDDESADGSMLALRKAIHRELSNQLGRSRRDFRIWQDNAAIPDGLFWEEEITQAINQSTFFVPILTPRALAGPHCAFEFKAFLAREARLGREDLIYPILYEPVPELDDEGLPQDRVHMLLHHLQYLDWRDMRLRDLDEPEVRIKLTQFCQNISDALRKPWEIPEERPLLETALKMAKEVPLQRISKIFAKRLLGDKALGFEETLPAEASAEGSHYSEEEQRSSEEAEAAKQSAEEQRRITEVEGQRRAVQELLPRTMDVLPSPAPPLSTRAQRATQQPKPQQRSEVRAHEPDEMLHARYKGLGGVHRWRIPIFQTGFPAGNSQEEILRTDRVQRRRSSDQDGAPPDNVDCSVFAPTAIRNGAEALIQVFLHIPADAIVALGIALTADASIDRQITHSLNIPIERGTSVQVFFDPGGLSIPNGVAADQSILWRGQPTTCAFRVRAPQGLFPRNYHPTIRVAVNGVLVGCITFRVHCSLLARPAGPLLAGAARAGGARCPISAHRTGRPTSCLLSEMYPITGTAGCCAPAVSGHAASGPRG